MQQKTGATTRVANRKQSNWMIAVGLFTISILMLLANSTVADPNPHVFEKWKTDFEKRTIKFGEVLSGGPIKDGIPAIDDPKFVSIYEATHLNDKEPVITFEHDGDARAYPLQVLMWHEIANDVVGGHPFAVTYCPLCNAAIVFDAQIDGKRHDFGTTGRLRFSDLLMYDRQTESWWQQFSGEALIGHYAGEKKLKIVPSRLESWGSFKNRYKKAKVLVPNDPGARRYGENPYINYDERNAPYPFYNGTLPSDINPMARVVVLRDNGDAKHIVSMEKIRNATELSIGAFKLSWSSGRTSALNASDISKGKDIGNLIVQKNENGKLTDSVHDITFAFVAHAFHPEVAIEQ